MLIHEAGIFIPGTSRGDVCVLRPPKSPRVYCPMPSDLGYINRGNSNNARRRPPHHTFGFTKDNRQSPKIINQNNAFYHHHITRLGSPYGHWNRPASQLVFDSPHAGAVITAMPHTHHRGLGDTMKEADFPSKVLRPQLWRLQRYHQLPR